MGKLIYITGLSGAGKTTIAKELQKQIPYSILLDGDGIRTTINKDLGFEKHHKIENIRRNNALIELLYSQGFTIICAFMASISSERDKIFEQCPNNIKVQLTTSIEECAKRDPKGYYKKNLDNFAGITSKYEPFCKPDLQIDTSKSNLEDCVHLIRKKIDTNFR